MAKKILKGLRLPGGEDDYIISSTTTTDLSIRGEAADAKSVGDALALKADQTSLEEGLALKADQTSLEEGLALKADFNHTHTKSQVGLGKVDNTPDKDKSVKYAISAGTANDISDWARASSKPHYSAEEVGAYSQQKTKDLINGAWRTATGTLTVGGWSSRWQNISCPGLTTSSRVIASADGNNTNGTRAWKESDVWAAQQVSGAVKFYYYEDAPQYDIPVIIFYEVGA